MENAINSSNGNVELPTDYTQVCVWPGTTVRADEIPRFEEFMKTQLGARVKYLEVIKTKADETGPGGRCDLFFAVHTDDIGAFALPRIELGIRWIEDCISKVNGGNRLYPQRVHGYTSWDANS